jgi:electron transfer flavoprotein beta subunit
MRIAVCAKQVPDPDIPPSQFKLDSSGMSVVPAQNVSPVINGFDLNAVEAALRIREATGSGAEITVISAGSGFALDVMKKALAMGADTLVLVDDPAAAGLDASATAKVLSAIVKKTGPFDLILCGRQASDWDQSHVPLLVAESLGLPCVTVARKVDVEGAKARVERVIPDGYQEIDTPLPALVTVSNELGEPRYPTLRGIMAAGRKQPERHTVASLGISPDDLKPNLKLLGMEVPQGRTHVELINGDDDAEKGRNLALRLRQEKLV